MHVTMQVTKPEDMMFSMNITMSLKDWLALRKQLNAAGWPGCDLVDKIRDATRQADTVFLVQGD